MPHTLNESIVEDAALTWFGELGYAIGRRPHMAPGEPVANGVFGSATRISIHNSPNLDLSSPNMSSSSSILRACSYVLKEAMP